MKPEAQQIAMLKACGWKKGELDCDGYQIWIHPNGARQYKAYIPDYLNDLNAMHQAETILTPLQQAHYMTYLGYGEEFVYGSGESSASMIQGDQDGYWRFFTATAAQRAEAFLKTLNLWTN